MKRHFKRRIRNTSIVLGALVAIWSLVHWQEQNLSSSAFTTGYLLAAAVVFLAAYSVRKKLPFLPLGSATTWLQWHVYVGLGSLALFGMHAGLAWPSGKLEIALASIYLLTFASGVFGLYLSRTIPRQLARVGEEVIFERIPALGRTVGQQAGEVVIESVSSSGATTLADFYIARLYGYFQRSPGLAYMLRPTTQRRRALMHEMQDVRRFLSEHELSACERLFALIRRKDDLDFHQARQAALKLWLFVHIALTVLLVAAALVHGLLAHAFRGGAA